MSEGGTVFDELYTTPVGHLQPLLIPMIRKSDSGKENRKSGPEKVIRKK